MGLRAGFFLNLKKYLVSSHWPGKNWNESTGK